MGGQKTIKRQHQQYQQQQQCYQLSLWLLLLVVVVVVVVVVREDTSPSVFTLPVVIAGSQHHNAVTSTAFVRSSRVTTRYNYQHQHQHQQLLSVAATKKRNRNVWIVVRKSTVRDDDDEQSEKQDINEQLTFFASEKKIGMESDGTSSTVSIAVADNNSSTLYSENDKNDVNITMDDNELTRASSTTSSSSGSTVNNKDDSLIQDMKLFLLSVGAITGRGEYATTKQKESVQKCIHVLEQNNQYGIVQNRCTDSIAPMICGTWELVYTNTELFRSSPFFMSGRAVCTTNEERDRYNWFCTMHRKALAISTIGNVRQIVSMKQNNNTNTTNNTNNNMKLVSEFEVKAGSIPFVSNFIPLIQYSGGLPVTIDGTIVSTADLQCVPGTDNSFAWEVYMDTVEIKGSNIPVVRQLLDYGDGIKLQTRVLSKWLLVETQQQQQSSSSSQPEPSPSFSKSLLRPLFRTTYLDTTIRISRDQDDHIFVYIKTSNQTEPTNYKSIVSDFGILSLLEGFNDAVTKIYL